MATNWDYLGDLGMGLLANGGVSTTPRTFGQGLGNAAIYAGQQQGVREDRNWTNLQRSMSLQEMARKQQQEAQAAERFEAAVQSLPPQLQPIARVQGPKFFEAQKLGQGDQLVSPGMQAPIAAVPPKPDPMKIVTTDQGIFAWDGAGQLGQKLGNAPIPAPLVNIDNKGSSKLVEAFAKNMPEEKAIADRAATTIQRIQEIRPKLDRVPVGVTSSLRDKYNMLASAFGLEVPELAEGQSVDNALTSLTAAIAKTFGANPSVYETQLLQVLSGNRSIERSALNDILRRIEDDSYDRVSRFNSQLSAIAKQDPLAESLKIEPPPRMKMQPKQKATEKPKSKFFNIDGKQITGRLGDDGNYYTEINGQRFKVEE